ncbi:MAG: LysR family transcriptional regulator [Eubacteriaceae bacterium]|nr:LysR family transcriptional regulator [Eubacteriaceae bacterium]
MENNYLCFVKLRLESDSQGERHAFGPGTADLLRGVERLGSLNKAAKEMEMAYSKAWRLIRATEADLGFDLIERKARDGSEITEECKALLVVFDEMTAAAQAAAQKVLSESIFGKTKQS